MAYSLDLRKRVVAAVERGLSRTQAAKQFQVGRTTITEWVTQQRTTGSLAAQSPPGRPRRIGASAAEVLRAQLTAQPDATLQAHVKQWDAQHPAEAVSIPTMFRAIQRLGWTRKKSRSAPGSKTRRNAPSSRHSSSPRRPRRS